MLRNKLLILCALLVCWVTANAQDADRDLSRQREEFIAKVFTKCHGSGSTYYLGPRHVLDASCLGHTLHGFSNGYAPEVRYCAELREYSDVTFPDEVVELPHT